VNDDPLGVGLLSAYTAVGRDSPLTPFLSPPAGIGCQDQLECHHFATVISSAAIQGRNAGHRETARTLRNEYDKSHERVVRGTDQHIPVMDRARSENIFLIQRGN
jgi:hypothetical protein